jgi:hypothetical protein
VAEPPVGASTRAQPAGDSFPRFLLRFLLIAAILGFAAVRWAQPVTEALLPLFKGEIARLDDAYRIDRLYIDRDAADQVVRIDVGLARPLSLNGRTFYPDPRGRATASTLVGNVTLPCVLMIAVSLAWPCRSGRRFVMRALVLMPALLLLCLLDVPFILWASIWGLIVQAADPNRFSPLLMWCDFLLGGGGFALAMAFGACIGSLNGRSSRL